MLEGPRIEGPVWVCSTDFADCQVVGYGLKHGSPALMSVVADDIYIILILRGSRNKTILIHPAGNSPTAPFLKGVTAVIYLRGSLGMLQLIVQHASRHCLRDMCQLAQPA